MRLFGILTVAVHLQDSAEYNLARLRERRVAAESAKTVIQSDLEAAAESRVRTEQVAVAKLQAANAARIEAVRITATDARRVVTFISIIILFFVVVGKGCILGSRSSC